MKAGDRVKLIETRIMAIRIFVRKYYNARTGKNSSEQ